MYFAVDFCTQTYSSIRNREYCIEVSRNNSIPVELDGAHRREWRGRGMSVHVQQRRGRGNLARGARLSGR
jgi:hypothetical protein